MTGFAKDELHELQAEYLDDLAAKLKMMREHAEALAVRGRFRTSFPVLLFLTHQIKGSGGSLGFPQVSEIAKRMSADLNSFLEADDPPKPADLAESVTVLAAELDRALLVAREQISA